MRTLIELFSSFSFYQIILFIILLAIVIKELVEFIDWVKSRNDKEYEERKMENELAHSNEERLDKLETNMTKMSENINHITDKVDLLVKSDRDDIKAFITKEHHYFCYDKGWIDDYSLDCLEHRFQHYQEEEGNSFIEGLMTELRALPKTDPEQHK
jgi:hypothetical protein